jgi:hypothetical protein
LELALGKSGLRPAFSSKSKETVQKSDILEQPHIAKSINFNKKMLDTLKKPSYTNF